MVKPRLGIRNGVAVGERIFFKGSDDGLWISDGTESGTLRVRDIGPANTSFPLEYLSLTEMDGTVYFLDSHGLWRTDGTAAGTGLISRGDGAHSRLIVLGSTLYFGWSGASMPDTGWELWRSDGTETGTAMVKDANPGPESGFSLFSPLGSAGGLIYYIGNSPGSGSELWRSDGTPEGTFELKDIYPGLNSGAPKFLTAVGDLLMFAAETPANGCELWKTDGSVAGTALVRDIVPGSFSAISGAPDDARERPGVLGGNIFFKAFSSNAGWELWKSNGTAAGTSMVKDLAPPGPDGSPFSSYPGFFLTWKDAVYFWTSTNAYGNELWRTDGTAAGTFVLSRRMDADRTHTFTPPTLGVAGDRLLFAGWSGPVNEELWATDGTVAGTVPVRKTSVGAPSDYVSSVSPVIAVGEEAYFRARSPDAGLGLWRSERNHASASLVRSVPALNSFSTPDPIVSAGKLTYFVIDPGTGAKQLWRTDGTPAGTSLVKPLWQDTLGQGPLEMAALGGRLLFTAHETATGQELWVTDDTGAAPALLKDIYPGTENATPRHLTVIGETAYFSAYSSGSARLWKTDGTAAGTVSLRAFTQSGSGGDYRPSSLTAAGSTLFFTADTSAGRELWKSDGQPAGTVMVRDIQPGLGSSLAFDTPLAPLADRVYFQASQEVIGTHLWSSDGTAAGTVSAWRQDETHRLPLSSTAPLIPCGRLLYYLAGTPAAGAELWRTDNTPAGTFMVRDIYPGEVGSSVKILGQKYGILYFAACDDRHGLELWRTDGTQAGTIMVSDLVPGFGSSQPVSFAATKEGIYYGVEDDGTGHAALMYLSWPAFQGAAEIQTQPDGGVKLRFTGLRPGVHAVDATTDLRIWTQLSTENPNAIGALEYMVPATSMAGHFFRVRDIAQRPVP